MKNIFPAVAAFAITLLSSCGPKDGPKVDHMDMARKDVLIDSYYKDLFMDGGIYLTSRKTLPAANYLDLDMEYFISRNDDDDYVVVEDSLYQQRWFGSSEVDENGFLLYPDGSPRFKVIYVNGGKSSKHGTSLSAESRANVQSFVFNGGSYVGTCAGMFIAGIGYDNVFSPSYFRLYQGRASHTSIHESYTGMFVEENCPLLKYYDFGGDLYVDRVWHNGGGYGFDLPAGTEILMRYDTPDSLKVHLKPSVWAYKKYPQYGRIVVTGSHPEGVESGERRDFFASMILYAIDGRGIVVPKGELYNGEAMRMDKSTSANDPAHTKIGDRQCHHFITYIPAGAKNINVYLEGKAGYNLSLMMDKDTYAFPGKSDYENTASGNVKKLSFDTLSEGLWYIGVQCTDVPVASTTSYGWDYTKNTEVLNGVPYSIRITWD